jgi:hypothetical protein
MDGSGDSLSCYAYAKSLTTGEEVEGPKVTIQMAKDEGWFGSPAASGRRCPT